MRLLSLALMLMAFPAWAQDVPKGQRAIDLMWNCQGEGGFYNLAIEHNHPDPRSQGFFDLVACGEYIAGMADMNAIHEKAFGQSLYCFPTIGVSTEQQIRIFLKWAENNPGDLQNSKRISLVLALQEAFPCPD